MHIHTAVHSPHTSHTAHSQFTSRTSYTHSTTLHTSTQLTHVHTLAPLLWVSPSDDCRGAERVRTLVIVSDRNPLKQGKGIDIHGNHLLSIIFGPSYGGSHLFPTATLLCQRSYPRMYRWEVGWGRVRAPGLPVHKGSGGGLSLLEYVLWFKGFSPSRFPRTGDTTRPCHSRGCVQ